MFRFHFSGFLKVSLGNLVNLSVCTSVNSLLKLEAVVSMSDDCCKEKMRYGEKAFSVPYLRRTQKLSVVGNMEEESLRVYLNWL